MRHFTLDTITPRENQLMDKLTKLFFGSDFYKKTNIEPGVSPQIDRRSGSVSFNLSSTFYTLADDSLKVSIRKEANRLVDQMNAAFSLDGVSVALSTGRYKNVTFTLNNYHEPVSKTVPRTFGKGSISHWTVKVVRLAEVLNEFYGLNARFTDFFITFFRNENGKAMKTSASYLINQVGLTERNYGARVMYEASRLLKICEDMTDYEFFEPNAVVIRAKDTLDTFQFNL